MKTTHFKRYRNVVLTKAAASLDAFFCSKLFLIRSHLLHTYIHICMYVQSFQSTYIYETAKKSEKGSPGFLDTWKVELGQRLYFFFTLSLFLSHTHKHTLSLSLLSLSIYLSIYLFIFSAFLWIKNITRNKRKKIFENLTKLSRLFCPQNFLTHKWDKMVFTLWWRRLGTKLFLDA